MNDFIEAVFDVSILTGKISHDFYCLMAQTVSDNGINSMSDQLGRDEDVHLKTFVLWYPGDEFDLLALVSSQSARDHPADFVTVVRDGRLYEQNARKIAISEKLDCLVHAPQCNTPLSPANSATDVYP